MQRCYEDVTTCNDVADKDIATCNDVTRILPPVAIFKNHEKLFKLSFFGSSFRYLITVSVVRNFFYTNNEVFSIIRT